MAHADLMRRLSAEFRYVDPLQALVRTAQASSMDDLFAPNGHYGPVGNRVVATVVEKELFR